MISGGEEPLVRFEPGVNFGGIAVESDIEGRRNFRAEEIFVRLTVDHDVFELLHRNPAGIQI